MSNLLDPMHIQAMMIAMMYRTANKLKAKSTRKNRTNTKETYANK